MKKTQTQSASRSKESRPSLSDEGFEMVASRFKALSEPVRLKLLNALEGGEKNVTQLLVIAGTSQANVSKHLSLLMEAKMVSRRKEGVNAYYYISDPTIYELCDLMCHKLQKDMDRSAKSFLASSAA
jgi:ArsR family transcriptional regulator